MGHCCCADFLTRLPDHLGGRTQGLRRLACSQTSAFSSDAIRSQVPFRFGKWGEHLAAYIALRTFNHVESSNFSILTSNIVRKKIRRASAILKTSVILPATLLNSIRVHRQRDVWPYIQDFPPISVSLMQVIVSTYAFEERLWTDFRGTAVYVAAILFVYINRWKFATSFFLRLR